MPWAAFRTAVTDGVRLFFSTAAGRHVISHRRLGPPKGGNRETEVTHLDRAVRLDVRASGESSQCLSTLRITCRPDSTSPAWLLRDNAIITICKLGCVQILKIKFADAYFHGCSDSCPGRQVG